MRCGPTTPPAAGASGVSSKVEEVGGREDGSTAEQRPNRWRVFYYDARADDARLTLDVAATAVRRAVAVNYCSLTGVKVKSGVVNTVELDVDGSHISLQTRCIVNAAGVGRAG